MISLSVLDGHPAIRHAFFTREGGVSEGLYASLNCGFGSGDDKGRVQRNREIAAFGLGLSADRLVSCHQVHGTAVIRVERPWRREANPRADGMVAAVPGIALGVLGALALGRLIAAQLFGVGAADPVVLGGVVVTLASVAFCACAIPTLRAARVAPMEALRND